MKRDKAIRLIFYILILILLFSGVFGLFGETKNLVYDRFLSSALLIGILLMYKRMNMNNITLFFAVLAIALHNGGFYGNTYFGINFDRYEHFLGGFAATLVFIGYLRQFEKKKRINLKVILLSIAITAGLGSFVEILEFIGYTILGEGVGILFYGTGDFGEWNNAAWDMICNTLGALTASLIPLIIQKKK